MTTRTSNYVLRLQTSLMDELHQLPEQEGTTINQLSNVAVAEKVSALRAALTFKRHHSW